MGVTGLWTVVAPTARPTHLASLNRKRLAVDASIWIYQFLKAVRDKEGNALRNSHVVGFFRRICKLLFFGIKPVFVFDGGAPVLKRETVRSRARRREGRREDAARTAGKLLAVQVARAAEEEEKRQRTARDRTPLEDELPNAQELVYVDEIGMNQKERQAGRGFRRKDQYHLPDLDVSIASMGAPNDPRIMSQAELEEYARQFHSGEDINLYDFSKIDFESPFFLSLPPGDKYNILNAARLRSRLRMGYSKDQLDEMFPDRMAFSRFQVERVKERNELTQRLMHINGMSEDVLAQGGRIAGEKGKEYVLVKNEGVEGGWALGVVSNKTGARQDSAIDLEEERKSESEPSETGPDDDDFIDVEIEGLNRLPKQWQRKRKVVDYDTRYEDAAEQIAKKRRAVYDARAHAARSPSKSYQLPIMNAEDVVFVPEADAGRVDEDDLFEDVDIDAHENDDDDLQRAIAMSMEQPSSPTALVLDQDKEIQTQPSALDVGLDFEAALAESRKAKFTSPHQRQTFTPSKFSGPLPFESLNLGQSLLGKKKAKKVEEDLSGGFDRNLGEDAFRKERPAQPIPSWFVAAPRTNGLGLEQRDTLEQAPCESELQRRLEPPAMSPTGKKAIDLDAEDPNILPESLPGAGYEGPADEALVPLDTKSTTEYDDAIEERRKENVARDERYRIAQEIADANDQDQSNATTKKTTTQPSESIDQSIITMHKAQSAAAQDADSAVDVINWSASDDGHDLSDARSKTSTSLVKSATQSPAKAIEIDSGEDHDFEDVPTPEGSPENDQEPQQSLFLPDEDNEQSDSTPLLTREASEQQASPSQDDGYFSDSDEELMRQLAVEAEEHARFASSLTSKTPAEAARDYENELKQLRNQQKKDRRDADEVTQTMVLECQALLRLFGLPYITAPMEAEAQCAELVHLGLVDGIVTDDSDIFLFGGTRIYKNMFNAAKFVECYLAADLGKEYALDRRKLIRFAHLLGSDYTEGVQGIGPVTALEILADFDTLEEFREWCSKVQLGRPQDLESQLTTAFRRKFRVTAQKRLFLPPGFPDLRVDQAYLKPEVDSTPEEFQWGVPDLDKLRSFLMATIGWSQERTDEILVPVIRDMNKRDKEGTQANLTRFFTGAVGVGATEGNAPRNRTGKESGRMANAFKRLRGEAARKTTVGDESAWNPEMEDERNITKYCNEAGGSEAKRDDVQPIQAERTRKRREGKRGH